MHSSRDNCPGYMLLPGEGLPDHQAPPHGPAENTNSLHCLVSLSPQLAPLLAHSPVWFMASPDHTRDPWRQASSQNINFKDPGAKHFLVK